MASSTPTLPVSLLISNKASSSTAADEPQKRSREDWRKAKELEEARKAGTAPAAVDEEGNVWCLIYFFIHLANVLILC